MRPAIIIVLRHVTSYIEKKMAENSWYDPRIVLRYKGEEEKGAQEEEKGRGWEELTSMQTMRWCREAREPIHHSVDAPCHSYERNPTLAPPTGLFATAPLRKGDLVLVFTGKLATLPDLLAAGDRCMELSLQVGRRRRRRRRRRRGRVWRMDDCEVGSGVLHVCLFARLCLEMGVISGQ